MKGKSFCKIFQCNHMKNLGSVVVTIFQTRSIFPDTTASEKLMIETFAGGMKQAVFKEYDFNCRVLTEVSAQLVVLPLSCF